MTPPLKYRIINSLVFFILKNKPDLTRVREEQGSMNERRIIKNKNKIQFSPFEIRLENFNEFF